METGKIKKTANKTLERATENFNLFINSLFGKIPKSDANEVERAAQVRKRVGIFTGFLIMSFMLAGTAIYGDSRPFALALLCAAGQSIVAPVFIGSVIGTLVRGQSVFITLFVYVLAFFSRYFLSKKARGWAGKGIFAENLQIRAVLGAAMGFVLGIFGVALHRFDLLSVINLAIMTFATPFLCVVFGISMTKTVPFALKEAAMGAFLWVVVFSLRSHTLLGFSLAGIIAFAAILYVSFSGGMFRGAIAGFLCATALDASYVIPLCAAGLVSGALWQVGAGVAVCSSMAICVGWSVYFGGLLSIFGFASDAMFAGLVLLPLIKTGILKKSEIFAKNEAVNIEILDKSIETSENDRLCAMSEAFDELSEMFLKLAEKQRIPGSYELYGVCDTVFTESCRKCSMAPVCWKKDYTSTADITAKMVNRLRTGGALSASDVPDFFRMRCRSIDSIIAKINLGAANLLENTVKRDKTELFALDYQAMSRLLHESAKGKENENAPDPALSKRFADLLSDMQIACTGVYAYGTRKKTLVASGISAGTIEYSTRELRLAVSKSLEIKVTEPKFEFSGAVTTLSFETLPILGIRSHVRSRKKEGESISGDVCSVFTGRDSRAYALISDGMGSGREAAVAAKICAVFLEKMLSAGCTKDVTLRLLSNFIRARGDECHSTVDLFEADLHTGTAEFLKSGAVPSYLVRDGSVFRMDARTLPLGITKEIDTKALLISVKPGDLIVMVSDGVAGDVNQALAEMAEKTCDPEAIADKLYSLCNEKDDSSIIVLEIVEYIDSL